jgi:hypothetical protein
MGNKFNQGVRSLQSTPYGLFLGTVNPWDGTEVFLAQPSPPAPVTLQTSPQQLEVAPDVQGSSRSPSPPERLEAESQGETALLSWEPSPQAVQFHVLRSTHSPADKLAEGVLPEDAWVAGPYTAVGTTSDRFYRDSTIEDGSRYTYYVQAEGKEGQLSEPSNVVMAPSFSPAVTFDQMRATVRDLARRRKIKAAATVNQLTSYLTAARSAAQKGRWSRARALLEALNRKAEQSPRGMDPLAAEDLKVMVAKLLRRVELAESGVVPIRDLLVGGRPPSKRGTP